MKIYAVLTLILCVIMVFFPLISMALKNELFDESLPAQEIISDKNDKNSISDTNNTISVLRVSSDKVIDVDIYDYIIGTVAAEMPITFDAEALKAQAVACYSYALWIQSNGDNAKNELYDISDSSESHQAYLDDEQLREKWGEKYEKNIKIIKDAVNSVLGEYLVYDNQPAMCVYHAISCGRTQSAKLAWGNDIPYLHGTVAPGDTLSPDFENEVTLTSKEVAEKLSLKQTDDNIKIETESNESGYVSSVSVGNDTFTGTQFAAKIGLNSPCFTVTQKNDSFTFNVKGKGHGIGMSQYSADYMARQGNTYKEILAHFYEGTDLTKS